MNWPTIFFPFEYCSIEKKCYTLLENIHKVSLWAKNGIVWMKRTRIFVDVILIQIRLVIMLGVVCLILSTRFYDSLWLCTNSNHWLNDLAFRKYENLGMFPLQLELLEQ